MRATVKPAGHVVIATFDTDGPTQCSNLDVRRYTADDLCGEFGDDFELIDNAHENHQTPWNSEQKFIYCLFRRKGSPDFGGIKRCHAEQSEASQL